MRGRSGIRALAVLAVMLGTSAAVAQDAPPPSLSQPAPSAQPPVPPAPGNAGDLAGPGLSPGRAPVNPATQPLAEAAPLRVAPQEGSIQSAVQALGRAVLTVDQEAMYRQSRWGRRAQAELGAQSRQVAADNDRAFADLVADEDALTAARATLSPEEFRTRAARFDERVTAVRQERQAALDELTETAELDRALFFQAAAPVLGRVMTSRGALVVLDQRTVLIADERIDATAATIAALDAELGDGREIVANAQRAQAEAEKRAAEKEGAEQKGEAAAPQEGAAIPVPDDRAPAPAETPASPEAPQDAR